MAIGARMRSSSITRGHYYTWPVSLSRRLQVLVRSARSVQTLPRSPTKFSVLASTRTTKRAISLQQLYVPHQPKNRSLSLTPAPPTVLSPPTTASLLTPMATPFSQEQLDWLQQNMREGWGDDLAQQGNSTSTAPRNRSGETFCTRCYSYR